MDKTDYKLKRLYPPFWQHDYHVLRRLHKILKQSVQRIGLHSGTIVDYGCGTKPYRSLFPQDLRYIGVDIGPNPDAEYHVKEDETIPLKNNSADLVLSTQVLEHVRHPQQYLSEAYRIVKRGGTLVLSTHGIWPYHPYPIDHNRWTREGLVAEIEDVGFHIERIDAVLGPFATLTQATLIMLIERLRGRSYTRRLLCAFFSVVGNSIIWLEDAWFPPTENSDASLFVICAKKK